MAIAKLFTILASISVLVTIAPNVAQAQGNAVPPPASGGMAVPVPPGPAPSPAPQKTFLIFWNDGCKGVKGCNNNSECYCGGYNLAFCGFLCRSKKPSNTDYLGYKADNPNCVCHCDYQFKTPAGR